MNPDQCDSRNFDLKYISKVSDHNLQTNVNPESFDDLWADSLFLQSHGLLAYNHSRVVRSDGYNVHLTFLSVFLKVDANMI